MTRECKAALKKLTPQILEARDRNLNEADTRIRVVRLLADVLGYDELSEITAEQRVKRRYVDFAIKLDGVVKFLIEVKPAAMTLRDRYIEQSQRYASEGNIRWVVLTNGVEWNLYHLTFEEGIDYSKAFSVDLANDSLETAANLLGLLHKKSILKGEHDQFWQAKLALSPESLGKALFTEDALRVVRREVRRNEGFQIDIEDLAKAIHDLFSPEAREQMGPYKIRTPRKAKRKPKATGPVPVDPPASPSDSGSTQSGSQETA